MGYELFFDDDFEEHIERFSASERKLIYNKIDFLKNDPARASLRTEKLFKGKKNEIWASSINMGIRLIWKLEGNIIYIKDVGRHDVYRKYNKGKRRRSQ